MRLLNRVAHMDALDLMACIEDDTIDMVLTSPPYDNLRTYTDGYTFDFEAIAHETYRVLKPGGVLVWVVGDATINGSETLTSMRQALYFVDDVGFKMHDTMIWQKNGAVGKFNRYTSAMEYMFVLCKGGISTVNLQLTKSYYAGQRGYKTRCSTRGTFRVGGKKTTNYTTPFSNVWHITTGYGHITKDKEAYQHPAMFPEKLAERHILTWSNPGDVVLDYFLGSGTTAKMARKHSRNFIGGDISAEYVDIARKRLDKPYTMPMFDEQPKLDDKAQQLDMFDSPPLHEDNA
jgi:site-specific DNA-methyltransferase (adenine-specific)